MGGLFKNIPVKIYQCYDILDINAEEHFLHLFTIKTSNSNNITRNYFLLLKETMDGCRRSFARLYFERALMLLDYNVIK